MSKGECLLGILVFTALGGAACEAPPEQDTGVTTSALRSDVYEDSASARLRDVTGDDLGAAASVATSPIDLRPRNPFFHDFGTNGRTCGTCHQEAFGWTITPEFARSRPADDPLFVFDGSDCLPPGQPNRRPRVHSTMMLDRALVRIELGVLPTADFELVSAVDPLHCPTPPVAAALRMYRRPLPAANTAFLSTVMWDGRENVNPPNNTLALLAANLKHQANDATRGHAQGMFDLSDDQQTSIVAFETGLFNAQSRLGGLELDARGAHGGPRYLLETVAPAFSIGINDVFSPSFTSRVFTIFATWEPGGQPGPFGARAAAVGRGEALFNSKTFTIDGVRGLNSADPDDHDPVAGPLVGTCGTCHDSPNVGNHSVSFAIDIGLTAPSPTGLDVSRLPTYTFRELATGKTLEVTDPGRGLVTGKFKDLGKTKGPTLRALATRAPYFHNGSAADLETVVAFYDTRFGIGLTAREKDDLVAFLSAL